MRQVQKLASKNRRISAASIALEVAEVEGQLVSAQTICYTLQQACKQFAEDNLAKSINYWSGSWFLEMVSCGLMSLR